MQMQRLGCDWYLTRLALPTVTPEGNCLPPLLPVHLRYTVTFADTFEMHLIADFQDAIIEVRQKAT